MISVTKLRSGSTFEMDDVPYRTVEYKHTHLSRGSGTIRLKARDLSTGRLKTLTFKSGDQVQDIDVERRNLQYLYEDGSSLYFMDPRSFEQVEMSKDVAGESAKFLKEGSNVFILFWEESALEIDLPPKIEVGIVECAPGEKGNSASNVYKDAIAEGGIKLRVPLFVNVGDRVRIDTRTGEYAERV